MLRTMRENTKWIMLITAVAFVGLMVFEWGMDMSGRSSMGGLGGEIGKVNGKAVTYEEFHDVYQNLYQQRQLYQDDPITSAEIRQLEDLAWDQVVMEHLIQEEIRSRGLEATPVEIRQAALFAPPPEFYSHELFQTDGQFDLQKYQEFLASPAVDDLLLLQLEAYYRDMIARNKLFQQVASSLYLTDADLWRNWRDRAEQASIRYIAIHPDALVRDDEITITDDEVTRFYREHRRDFVRPANATVRVTVLEKEATPADTTAARERALEIREQILAGADFGELARSESADPGSAQRGGDLGTFTKGQMVPAFEQAVWSAPLNEVTEPVQTNYGFHLIMVTSRSGDEASAKHILIPIERSIETEDAILDAADSLEYLALRGSLDEAAEELGLSVREAEVTKEFPFVVGVGDISEGAEWALDDEVELGELSPLFETPQGFYLLELVSRERERTMSIEEATAGIRDRLLESKKYEAALARGREIVGEVRNSSLDEVASSHDLPVQETEPFSRFDFVPGLGQANPVIGAAFGLEPGKTSDLLEANGLLYIIETVEHIPADEELFEEQKDQIRAQLVNELQQERWEEFLGSLREQARVVDNRNKVLTSSTIG